MWVLEAAWIMAVLRYKSKEIGNRTSEASRPVSSLQPGETNSGHRQKAEESGASFQPDASKKERQGQTFYLDRLGDPPFV